LDSRLINDEYHYLFFLVTIYHGNSKCYPCTLSINLVIYNFAVLLFITDSVFLGFAYILVYIGAICVLFLYIILLLHMRTYSLMQRFNTFLLLGLIAFFIAGISYINVSFDTLQTSAQAYQVFYLTDLQLFTSYLFMTHQHYMFLSILLLLLALFLAIFLSTRFLTGKTSVTHNIL
jgi:NADH:ubiquinone oxidoreductase subunit 6 (subunit J)